MPTTYRTRASWRRRIVLVGLGLVLGFCLSIAVDLIGAWLS
jgi:uncharacterized protein involved in exopolysaccharide biosynthesis